MLQVEGSSRDQQSRKKQIKSSCNLENTEAVSFQFLARTVQTLAQPCYTRKTYYFIQNSKLPVQPKTYIVLLIMCSDLSPIFLSRCAHSGTYLTSLRREDCNGGRSGLARLDEWQDSFDGMYVALQISIQHVFHGFNACVLECARYCNSMAQHHCCYIPRFTASCLKGLLHTSKILHICTVSIHLHHNTCTTPHLVMNSKGKSMVSPFGD